MIRMSDHKANSIPPATADPSIAAIIGFDSIKRVGPIGPGRGSSIGFQSAGRSSPAIQSAPSRPAAAFRSNPAQNPPAPVSTATSTAGSASKSVNAANKARAVAGSTALRAALRCTLTTLTRPCVVTATVIASSPPKPMLHPPTEGAPHARDRGKTRPSNPHR